MSLIKEVKNHLYNSLNELKQAMKNLLNIEI